MIIGTWNVLSLTSTSVKLHKLATVISQYKVDVLLLTETHWPGTEVEILSYGAMIINCGRSDGICRQVDKELALFFRKTLQELNSTINLLEYWIKFLGKIYCCWVGILTLVFVVGNRCTVKGEAIGGMIFEQCLQEQRERWAEHFSTLLNPQTTSADLTQLDSIPVEPRFNSLSQEDQAPASNEILAALSKLKSYKSPGIDGICNE